jgi:RNA polymerase sigma-70 factor (ECF subfamily)
MLSQNGALARLRCMMTDTTTFSALRPRLFAIAYRMLGVRADAEDVVQDAWLRWHGSAQEAVQSAEAWLVTITTRLAIDRLRSRLQSASPMWAGGCPNPSSNWTNTRRRAMRSWPAKCRWH